MKRSAAAIRQSIIIIIIVHIEVPFLHIISLLLQSGMIFPGISIDNTAIPAAVISMPALDGLLIIRSAG